MTVSKTPKSFFFIGLASRLQLSAKEFQECVSLEAGAEGGWLGHRLLTEVTNEVCRLCVWCPFAISYISILLDDESISLVTPRELFETTFMSIDRVDPIVVFVGSNDSVED